MRKLLCITVVAPLCPCLHFYFGLHYRIFPGYCVIEVQLEALKYLVRFP